MTSSNVDGKPRVGMKVYDIKVAYQFWLGYNAHVGFGLRRHYANKSKRRLKKDSTISSCRFACCKEGL